jgi:hypothetical protein
MVYYRVVYYRDLCRPAQAPKTRKASIRNQKCLPSPAKIWRLSRIRIRSAIIPYLDYIPDRKCVELKSLKLYYWSYRDEGGFHEAVTNKILSDLVAATDPRFMRLRAEFNVRGGIYTNVVVEHHQPGWQGETPPTRVS